MRSLPYIENDPKDYSMLTQPKLKINDVVIVWDEEEGGEWVQADVMAAQFNRAKKCWTYEALTALVDCPSTDRDAKPELILPKQWYYFTDEELKEAWVGNEEGRVCIDHYIVIPKQ